MGLRMIEKRPRVAEATKYKPSADSASNAVVDTTWSSLGKYVETTACRTYTKPPNIKHPNAPKMEMKRTRKRFASAGVCVCMAMVESDNGNVHRAAAKVIVSKTREARGLWSSRVVNVVCSGSRPEARSQQTTV